tara:strand:- start:363 stop:767 length:405 start_codon:yes stop_codon:yes gene_type:complete
MLIDKSTKKEEEIELKEEEIELKEKKINKTQEEIKLKHIIKFLKDMFPQYDEDILEIIYNYTTNLDETIIKLIDMNKEYDINYMFESINRDLDEQDKESIEDTEDFNNPSQYSLFSAIKNRWNRTKGFKYELLE